MYAGVQGCQKRVYDPREQLYVVVTCHVGSGKQASPAPLKELSYVFNSRSLYF